MQMSVSYGRIFVQAGLSFGAIMGLFFGIQTGNAVVSLFLGLFSGVLFGTGVVAFSWWSNKKMKADSQELDGEEILLAGPANHFLGAEGRGGRLYLTPTRLCFRGHGFNIQNKALDLPLEDVADVGFKNTLGIIPNGLQVHRQDGKKETFVVFQRGAWKQRILAVRDENAFS
jgi:hypothetical protein